MPSRPGFRKIPLMSGVRLLLAVLPVCLGAQPQPGDVFREYHYTSDMIVEFDHGSKRTDPKALLRRGISHRERSLDLWDLEDAVRAEMSLEFWGGHPGTSDQKFRVNASDWIAIPQIAGTKGDPRCYYRMLPGTVTAPVPLESLKQGRNAIEFRAGPQVCHSIDWGIYKVYSFTLRVYYGPGKPRPNGRIIAPRGGAAIGDMPAIVAEAEGSPAAPGKTEFTPGPVRKVEFLGRYEDFNWEGDGVWRQWHYQTEQGEMRRHIGTALAAPYRVVWDNRWVPDQEQPVELAARITSVHGITYMTPAVAMRLQRVGRRVEMYKAGGIPEVFGVRVGRRAMCPIEVPHDPAEATGARLALSTWAGNHADAFGLNDVKIVDRTGKDDYYSYDLLPFDPKILRRGVNEFFVFSNTKEHTVEINWPGPALLVEYPKRPAEAARARTFTEGPVFDAAGNLFFTHNEGIARLTPSGEQSDWVADASAGFNGHKILPDGTHLVCASKKRAVWRMDSNGRVLGAASSECDGKPLRAPNDITLDGRGGFYFTDPGGSREAPIGTVHYVGHDGKTLLCADGMRVPNGLVIDPGGRYLYVAETVPNRILRFPILAPGKLGTMEVFAGLPPREGHEAAPDGMAMDEDGNLYVAQLGRGMVLVLDRHGKLLHQWPAGNYDASNLAFGGPERNQLFITGSIGHRSKTEGRVFRLDLPGVRGR